MLDVNRQHRGSPQSLFLQEIYPGNKKKHFKKLHEQTSIPFRDMV